MADPYDTPGYRYSVNEFPGDGTTTDWNIQFAGRSPGYISIDHVRASVIDADGVETPIPLSQSNFIQPSLLRIEPAVAAGSVLRVWRDTPKGAPLLDYNDGALLAERNLDTSFDQAIYAAAEMVDRAADSLEDVAEFSQAVLDRLADVEDVAGDAAADAATAGATANTALSVANSAVATADSALAGVAGAEAAALLATAAADAANAAAATATTAAADAEQAALDALSTSASALSVANNAETVANGIAGTASAAQAAAAAAQAAASVNGQRLDGIENDADPEKGAALLPAAAGLTLADATLTVNTVAELRALPVPNLRPGKTMVINVLGFYAENDGAGGKFYWKPHSNEAAVPGMILVPASNPATGRWERVIEGEKIFVEQCGAKADYTPLAWTDNTAAVQAALNFASSRGKIVDGNGTFAISGQLSPTQNMTIVSDGTLKFKKPGTHAGRRIFYSSSGTKKGVMRIKGVGFEGDFNENPTHDEGRQIVAIFDADDITIEDCTFYAGRHFGLIVSNARRARIINNRVDLTCRDGIAVWATDDILIEGNTVTRTDDNGISSHVMYDAAPKVRTNVKILNNTLIDNAGPIQTLGAGDIIIRGNVIYRPKTFGIGVRQVGGGEGGHPFAAMNSLIIEENIIHDLIGNQWRVNGNAGGAQAVAPYIVIGSPTQNVPDWTVNPDGTYYTTQAEQLPMRNVKVRRNILTRTLPPVAAYSDWNLGDGAFVAHSASDGTVFRNSAVADADLLCIGIQVNGAVWDGDFSDNAIFAGYAGVQFIASGASAVDNLYRNVRVSRNKLFRNEMAWRVMSDLPSKHYDIEFSENLVDGDPHCTHANRGPNGTWLAATFPAVAQMVNVQGVRVTRNTIRNVARTVFGTGSTLNHFEDNLLACNPVQTGFSTSNVGVGDVSNDPAQYWATIEDGDPTSPTFGGNINTCPRGALNMPSTGKYVAGMFVRSRSLIVGGTAGSQYTVLGWKRLTTGDSHVLGTDWAECRALTGT